MTVTFGLSQWYSTTSFHGLMPQIWTFCLFTSQLKKNSLITEHNSFQEVVLLHTGRHFNTKFCLQQLHTAVARIWGQCCRSCLT